MKQRLIGALAGLLYVAITLAGLLYAAITAAVIAVLWWLIDQFVESFGGVPLIALIVLVAAGGIGAALRLDLPFLSPSSQDDTQ